MIVVSLKIQLWKFSTGLELGFNFYDVDFILHIRGGCECWYAK